MIRPMVSGGPLALAPIVSGFAPCARLLRVKKVWEKKMYSSYFCCQHCMQGKFREPQKATLFHIFEIVVSTYVCLCGTSYNSLLQFFLASEHLDPPKTNKIMMAKKQANRLERYLKRVFALNWCNRRMFLQC